jgi:hypothetical protein
MISTDLRGLALTLQINPGMAYAAAALLLSMAEDVALLEAAAIPGHLRAPTALPEGVVRLSDRRKQA